MKSADDLIRELNSEIDLKCAEIKRKKSERLLTRIFAAAAAVMLVVPAAMIFMGASLLTVFVPIIFVGVVFLAAAPILISKGASGYEQI